MEQHLRSLLLARTEVSALVGERVDWGLRPQGDPAPAICLTVIFDGPVDHSLDGPGISRARIQVDSFARSYGEAKAIGSAVRTMLDGYSDAVLTSCLLAGARDLQDGDADLRMHYVSADYLLTYYFNP